MSGDTAAEAILKSAELKASADETDQRRMALAIAVLALLLALASLGGDNASRETVNANILTSDYWVYSHTQGLQAASLRLARDNLVFQLQFDTELPPEMRAELHRRSDGYGAAIARLESQRGNPGSIPAIIAQAQAFEMQRDRAQLRESSFDYAQGLLQIAIILGSVSIASNARSLRPIVAVLSVVALVLLLNGVFLVWRI